MELKEKISYIKGLMQGMEYDVTTKDGKVMAAVVEALDEMARQAEQDHRRMGRLEREVGDVSASLADFVKELTDFMERMGDTAQRTHGSDELFEDGLYEITCPECGEVVCVDEDMLADESLACPNCGTSFEVDFEDEECTGGCGCSHSQTDE